MHARFVAESGRLGSPPASSRSLMPDNLLGRMGDFLQRRRPWYELPKLLAMPRLVEIRNQLRRENLHDTEEPALAQADAAPAPDAAVRQERSIDGSYNDLSYPQMGCAGRRFGRNFPLEHTFPDTANLMVPSPRVVSRELMTRHEFLPATILNLHAASWIQFMVHDWFVHKRSAPEDGVDIPLAPGDDWPEPRMRVPRSVPDAAPPGSTRPPAYVNSNSHWWDGSQIYGCDSVGAARLRTGQGGMLKVEPTKLLPVDPETGIHLSGFSDNWWIGLAMLHTLFTCEHNHLCERARPGAPLLGRRAAVHEGQAHQLGVDGQDSHRRVDAGHCAPPRHRDRDEHQLVRAEGGRTPGGLRVPERQRNSRGHRRVEARPSHRAVLPHGRVRLGLPDAPADSGSGGSPEARDRCQDRNDRAAGHGRQAHAGCGQPDPDGGSLLLVWPGASGRHHAPQLPAASPEPDPRRRRASRPGRCGHLSRP